MAKRFVSIWFRHLLTDKYSLRKPALKDTPFVLASPERGRVMVKAANPCAEQNGIHAGMVVADARALLPELEVLPYPSELNEKLLRGLSEWCLRYTPAVSVDLPDGLMLDVSGCAHLWGGERPYLREIITKLRTAGYDLRAAMADTIGCAWAIARFGKVSPLIEPGKQSQALRALPPTALRIEPATIDRLEKLGLTTIGSFMDMPRSTLRRRFGSLLLLRLDRALGIEEEVLQYIFTIEPYQVRQPHLIPVRTAKGMEVGLQELLVALCKRLEKEGKGLRTAALKCFRVDGNEQQITIGTGRPSRHVEHLFKLFETKIATLEPDLGFELLLLEAATVEDLSASQEAFWHTGGNCNQPVIAELLDRVAVKFGQGIVKRYLPDEHAWPERSIKPAAFLQEEPATDWRTDLPRPIHLLAKPEPITVTVPLPDYPPMLFHYKGVLHKVQKADGPERIEQEWWLSQGLYRDYYVVEDENAYRYWLFRLGHYDNRAPEWFIHGFFA